MKNLLIGSAALLFILSVNAPFAKADDTAGMDRDTASEQKKDDKKMEEKKADDKAADTQKAEDKSAEKSDEKAEAKSSGGAVTCKKGDETRTLEKKDMEGGGCEVIYTKGGEGKSIAQAKNDLSYCDKTIDKMKEKLSGGGFSCE